MLNVLKIFVSEVCYRNRYANYICIIFPNVEKCVVFLTVSSIPEHQHTGFSSIGIIFYPSAIQGRVPCLSTTSVNTMDWKPVAGISVTKMWEYQFLECHTETNTIVKHDHSSLLHFTGYISNSSQLLVQKQMGVRTKFIGKIVYLSFENDNICS